MIACKKVCGASLWVSLCALATAVLPAVAEEACAIDPDRLGARYAVTRTVGDGSEKEVSVQHIQLWRRGDQVAYVHEEREITEIWDLVSDGRQKLIRYFDGYERAIEYQPEDIETGSGEAAWNARYQLVPDAELAAMDQTGSSGSGCDESMVLSKIDEASGASVVIRWRPGLEMVEELERATGIETVTWELDALYTDGARVDSEFTRRHVYNTVDFVDIGDNESDPFLQKMINLGFIEHHAH
mgnify:FL=1|jgi:hypothetical protein